MFFFQAMVEDGWIPLIFQLPSGALFSTCFGKGSAFKVKKGCRFFCFPHGNPLGRVILHASGAEAWAWLELSVDVIQPTLFAPMPRWHLRADCPSRPEMDRFVHCEVGVPQKTVPPNLSVSLKTTKRVSLRGQGWPARIA